MKNLHFLLSFAAILGNATLDAATGFAITDDVVVDTVSVGPPVLNLDSFYEANSGQSLTVDATPIEGGPTSFAYQWYLNGFAIPPNFGGAASSYQISGVPSNEGTWRVVVTNSEGSGEASFEYRVFTDADGDGLSDYRESNITATDPNLLDSDSDGLNDYAEVVDHNTNPNDPDSDNDSLLDGAEINTPATDPNDSDSDDDGLSDGEEVNTHSTNPNDPDSDNDSLLDGAEINTHGTNPNLSDTDADGLSDADEINTHQTNPNAADSDSDGLSDGDEINTHGTNPLVADSSGDGLTDGFVVTAGFDPKTDYSALLTASALNARTAGQGDVTSDPASYGLVTQASYDAVVAERNARFTEDQINAMTTDPTIGRNAAGNMQVDISFIHSTDLQTFTPFAVSPAWVSVVDGKIALEFPPSNENTFFYRLGVQ